MNQINLNKITEQDKEQIVAAKCVWVLSFNDKNNDKINCSHREIIEILTNHKINSTNKLVDFYFLVFLINYSMFLNS